MEQGMSDDVIEISEDIEVDVVLDESGSPIGAIIDDLVVVSGPDGSIVDETVDILNADGEIVLEDEVVSVYDADGNLVASEEIITAIN